MESVPFWLICKSVLSHHPMSTSATAITKHIMVMKNNNNCYTVLHPFNGIFSRTTWVSRCQKSKNSLD